MTSEALSVGEPSVLALVAKLEEAGAMNAVSLTLDTKDPLTYETWEALGRFLGRISGAMNFWIGDWLNFGEEVYGEEFAQAVESTHGERQDIAQRITGKAPQTLANWASVCGRVAKSRRRIELDYTHHQLVAALEPEEQTEWLGRAVDEEWSSRALSEAISEARGTGAGTEPPPGGGVAGLSLSERLEAAARLVFHQGQPQRSGDVLVPGEAWQHLVSALGEE
jgi:hypothetical protein